MRKEIADFLPEICESLVNKAIDGDLAALKMLWQMAMLDGKTKASAKRGFGTKELGFARKALKEFRERGSGGEPGRSTEAER